MAYLSKQQYDRRRENAAQRALDNEQIAQQNGMTAQQAELISRLCSLRHDIHCNKDGIIKSDEEGYKRKILTLNEQLYNAGMGGIATVPTSTDDYIDIDTIDELREIEDVPTDDEERQAWYDDNYERISNDLEALNTNIEHYLADIDKQYNTHYAPTGALRNF